MSVAMSQPAPTMASPSQSSPPKKPRLSLQIKTTPTSSTGMTPAALKADIDPTSATAFNTLSNAYAAAIELRSPKLVSPPTGLDANMASNGTRKSGLRLVTNASLSEQPMFPSQHTQTPGPFTINYPDTPTPCYSATSPVTAHPGMRPHVNYFTFTPPQSAHPSDEPSGTGFSFGNRVSDFTSPMSPKTPRLRVAAGYHNSSAPYTHPRALHSILRNSPLPPRPSSTPMSPTRFSQRLRDRAAKKLCFNSPIEQTITTQTYTKSHIDLLAEESSPYSPTDPQSEAIGTLDVTMAYTGDETRDGGQTPGPFEEMRRRMAGLGAESDGETPRNKKRKRKDKKRQWVWTIGNNEDDAYNAGTTPGIASQDRSNTIQDQVHAPRTQLRREDAGPTPVARIHTKSKPFGNVPLLAVPRPPGDFGIASSTAAHPQSMECVMSLPTAINRQPRNLGFSSLTVQTNGRDYPRLMPVLVNTDDSDYTPLTTILQQSVKRDRTALTRIAIARRTMSPDPPTTAILRRNLSPDPPTTAILRRNLSPDPPMTAILRRTMSPSPAPMTAVLRCTMSPSPAPMTAILRRTMSPSPAPMTAIPPREESPQLVDTDTIDEDFPRRVRIPSITIDFSGDMDMVDSSGILGSIDFIDDMDMADSLGILRSIE